MFAAFFFMNSEYLESWCFSSVSNGAENGIYSFLFPFFFCNVSVVENQIHCNKMMQLGMLRATWSIQNVLICVKFGDKNPDFFIECELTRQLLLVSVYSPPPPPNIIAMSRKEFIIIEWLVGSK